MLTARRITMANIKTKVFLSSDELHMICNAIGTELRTNNQLTDDYLTELNVLIDRLQAIEELLWRQQCNFFKNNS
jgi:hypothetical protein